MTNKFNKQKGEQLGFRTPDFLRGKNFGGKQNRQKYNPAKFKTQHKG